MKRVNPGELTVRVRIMTPEDAITPGGTQARTYRDAGTAWCKWTNIHGTETLQAYSFGLREPATLMLRYQPGLRTDSVIIREADSARYEVLSVDDVEQRHRWMEIKVQRQAKSV